MDRLTKDDILKIVASNQYIALGRIVGKQISHQILQELLQYKSWEEENGISFDKVDKILKFGIYYKTPSGEIVRGDVYKINKKKIFVYRQLDWDFMKDIENGRIVRAQIVYKQFDTKDIGITWALTEEELLCKKD